MRTNDRKLLEVSDISIWYDPEVIVINNLSLYLEENEVIGLLGMNGAGKTTLINTLCGIHSKMKCSEVRFLGSNIEFNDDKFNLNRHVVFTEDDSFMYWSFDKYFKFIHKTYSKDYDQSFVDRMIKGFSFEKYKDYPLHSLSTGNKKKCFLITAFSLKCPLLILDEPIDGLDFESTEFLYELINEYREFGSVFMSSHIAESFDRTCDRVYHLDKGSLESIDLSKGIKIREVIKENSDV